MKRVLLLFVVFALTVISVYGQSTPACTGNPVNDRARIVAIVNATGTNDVTILLPYRPNPAQRCTIATSLSLPSRITLDFTNGSAIVVSVAGQTLTIAGSVISPPGKTIYFGPGNVVHTGALFVSNADPRLQLATTNGPGLVPTLPADPSKYLDGTGSFTVPAGGGGGGSGITTLNSQIGLTQSFGNSPNITWSSASNVHTATLAGPISASLLDNALANKQLANIFLFTNSFYANEEVGTPIQLGNSGNGRVVSFGIPAGMVDYRFFIPPNSGTPGSTNTVRVTTNAAGTEARLSFNAAQLSVIEGGTGKLTLGANNLLVGAGTSAVTEIAPGTSGWPLVSNGTSWAASQLGIGGIATSALTGNGTKLATNTGGTSSGKCVEWDASGNLVTAVSNAACGTGSGGGGGGAVNNASNIGSSGVGLFSALAGDVLQFKNLNAASTKISITINALLNTIDFNVPDATNSQAGAVLLAQSGPNTVVGTTDSRVPTQDENNALVGTYGPVSSLNPYRTFNDPQTQVELVIGQFTPATLNAAISSIGTSQQTVVINAPTLASSNVTVPSTATLRFTGLGRIQVSSGVVVTFQSGKVIADPQQQIFEATNTNTGAAGTGKVRWTGEMPPLSVKWWGAKGDGPTTVDDVAIKAAIAAMDADISGENPAFYKRGGILDFPNPTTYYRLSSTLDIYRPIHLRGAGTNSGSNAVPSVGLRWDTATTALRFHRHNTAPVTGGQSDGSLVTGLQLVGTFATSGTASVAGTANVSGLTVTRVTGPNYDENFNSGYTLAIDGYDYVVETLTSANSLAIYKPRLILAVTNGSTIVPHAFGGLPSWPATAWNGKIVKIEGVNYTVSTISSSTGVCGPTVPCLVLTVSYAGATKAQAEGQIQSLGTITGAATILNKLHGIDTYAQIKFEDVAIRGFSGNGVNVDSGTVPFGTSASDINANNLEINRVFSTNNKGHGFLFKGPNSNNVHSANLNATNNRGAGIMEIDQLGNVHVAPHLAENVFAPIFSNSDQTSFTLVGPYFEGGQPPSVGSQFGFSLFGTPGSAWTRPNMGYVTGGGRMFTVGSGYAQSTPLLFVREQGDDTGVLPAASTSFYTGETTAAYSTVLGFGAGDDSASNGGSFTPTRPGFAYRLTYCPAGSAVGGGKWSWSYNDPACADITKSVMTFSGSAALGGAAKIAFLNGFSSMGNVGIGTNSPATLLNLVHQSDTLAPLRIEEIGANAPDIRFRSALGTIASPSAVTANKIIGSLSATPYGATGYGTATAKGYFALYAGENATDTAMGTGAQIATTPLGSLTSAVRLTVNPAGNLGIGITTPLYKTHIFGANASPSLSAAAGILAIDAGSGSNELAIGGYSGSPFGMWLQAKDNASSGAGSGAAYPLTLNPLGGSVGGTFHDKGGAVFNCKNKAYGALGDGSTDDTTALNACFTAAAGNTAFIPAGTYVTDNLTAPAANTVILGAGAGVTIFKRKTNSTAGSLIGGLFGFSNTITLKNWTLDGNCGTPTYPGSVYTCSNQATVSDSELLPANVSDVLIDGIEFKNVAKQGILLYNADNLRVTNSKFTGYGSATVGPAFAIFNMESASGGSVGMIVENSTFTDWKLNAIITDSNKEVIRNNVFTGNHRQTIASGGTGGGQIDLTDNSGLLAGNPTISNNQFYVGGNTAGINTSCIEIVTDYAIIIGNRCEGGGVQNLGIAILGGTHYTITGNVMTGYTEGFHADEGVSANDYIVATNNDFSNNTTPVSVTSTGTHNKINGLIQEVALGANVASAAAIVLTGQSQHVTGTTTITSITTTGVRPGRYTLIFDGVLTFTDGSNLKIAGNFVTTADDTIVLDFDGTNFYEVSRTVN